MAAKLARPRVPPRGGAAARGPHRRPRPAVRRRSCAAARALPSWRAVLVAWAVVAAASGAYAVARETPLFAVRQIEVVGAPAEVAAAVRAAVDGFRGTSLVGLDGGTLIGRVDAVPTVYAAAYDRAFPHTLRIVVRAERPVAVLRAGTSSWLVSASARVLARVPRRSNPVLPRIWVPAATSVPVGATLGPASGGAAARALAPLGRGRFPVRIDSVALPHGELRLQLAGGTVVRLGAPDDLRLKLAVARRIVPQLPPGTRYLDVSVPERPVAGSDSQLSG